MPGTKSILIEKVEQTSTPVLARHSAELVDLLFVHEHGQWVLRFFIDKAGGITLDDCATISHEISAVLDAEDLIPQSYSLEVSSPGLNRPLKKPTDYQRFIGERVDVTLFAPLNGQRHFHGTIQAVDEEHVTVQGDPGQTYALPLADVAKARLDPDIQI